MVESLVHACTHACSCVCGEGVYMYMYVVSLACQPLAGKEGLDWTGCAMVVVAAESNYCVALTQHGQIIIEVGRHSILLHFRVANKASGLRNTSWNSPLLMLCLVPLVES